MEQSGPHWIKRYPGSISPDDLKPAFRQHVQHFLHLLRESGARLRISSTLRPPERAWLMHWAWQIAHAGQDPSTIPKHKSIPIRWLHSRAGQPDHAASRAAASAMVSAYGIAHAPALSSRHTQGRAIDMTIDWSGALLLPGFAPITSGPKNGLNLALIGIGANLGVHKLRADPPHWSDDGH